MLKKYRTLYWVFNIFHILLNVAPLITFCIMAYLESDLVLEKVCLSMTVLVVVILTAVTFINHVAMKSRLWILLIGLYFCLDFIVLPLVVIAICQVLDELIVHPISQHYKLKLTIRKEIERA